MDGCVAEVSEDQLGGATALPVGIISRRGDGIETAATEVEMNGVAAAPLPDGRVLLVLSSGNRYAVWQPSGLEISGGVALVG